MIPTIWFYGRMKTTIDMPDDLFRQAKAAAAIRGQTLKQLVTVAIERELSTHRTIADAGPSTEDFLEEIHAFAHANAVAWKTRKSAEEAVADMRNARDP